MRLKGKTISAPEPVTIKIFRAKEVIELKIAAVLSFDDFEKMVPVPKPPIITNVKKQTRTFDINDANYLSKIEQYANRKTEYMIIKGLEATEGLEWESVLLSEPDTWSNYRNDLLSCFTENEVSNIINGVNEANNPSSQRMQEAVDSFTQSQEEVNQQGSSSRKDEPVDTASGEPAKDLASDRQV